MGRGSWVGFLGEDGTVWRSFFGTAAEPFLAKMGVQAGEGTYERQLCPTGGADADEEQEEEEEEEEMRPLTAARGSI